MEQTFAKSHDFVQRSIAGECLLIPLRRKLTDVNSLYVLNDTGAAVWQRLDGARSIREIKDDLLNEYEVTSEQLEQDLHELITDLLSIEAVQEIHR